METEPLLLHRHKPLQVPLDDKEKAMKLYWHLLNTEPYNLGSTAVGPSQCRLTFASVLHLLQSLRFSPKSVFVDLGAGAGHVLLVAKSFFSESLLSTVGFELSKELVSVGNTLLPHFVSHETATTEIRLEQRDITTLRSLPRKSTDVFSFDKDFPPPVLCAVQRLLSVSSTWKTFTTSRPVRYWTRYTHSDWLERNTELQEKIPGTLVGSNQTHFLYIYRRKRSQPKRKKRASLPAEEEKEPCVDSAPKRLKETENTEQLLTVSIPNDDTSSSSILTQPATPDMVFCKEETLPLPPPPPPPPPATPSATDTSLLAPVVENNKIVIKVVIPGPKIDSDTEA